MTKTILITGGTRGIGLGIAKKLAKKGYNLVLNGIREQEQLTPVMEELTKLGAEVMYCQGDISSSRDRDRIIQTTLQKFDRIHVLVNNAGVGPEKRNDLLQTPEESYTRVMDTNLKGPFFLTQKIALHMIEAKSTDTDYQGCIINISSVSATMASTSRGEYCLSKAGMGMMTKLFATRLGEHDIPVYEVRPGIIATDMTQSVLKKYQGLIEEGLNIQPRIGNTEDVGKAVLALVESQFPYSTGQVFMVDGGLSVPRL